MITIGNHMYGFAGGGSTLVYDGVVDKRTRAANAS
jgi:hypothetical protein